MSIVDATSRMMIAIRKTIWIPRASWRMRFDTSLPQVTSSTAASFAFFTSRAIASVSSPRFGTTSKDAGSGFVARFEVSSGARLRMMAIA